MKRLAAFVPNVLGVAPGQRVRIETWTNYLNAGGWDVRFFCFGDDRLQQVLYRRGHFGAKAAGMLRCYVRQLEDALRLEDVDAVLIHREAALIGPAFIERLLVNRGIPVILDLDDPVFIPYKSPLNGWFSYLKWSSKTDALCRLSTAVIAINETIAVHARQHARLVHVLPNCIDTERVQPTASRLPGPPRLVWIGSHSTVRNLYQLSSVLKDVQANTNCRVRAIGPSGIQVPGLEIETTEWSADSEVADLQSGDVGLLPVAPHRWNEWKFFYKLVQYMAVGLPVVAQDLRSNREIVVDGETGFLVSTDAEWRDRLELLLGDEDLRLRMGKAARERVLERFSLQSRMPELVALLETVARPARQRSTEVHLPGRANGNGADSTARAAAVARAARVIRGFGDEWRRFDQTDLPPADYSAIFPMYFERFPWHDLPDDATGIDIGCGSGRWAAGVATRVGLLHCVDASAGALAVAKGNLARAQNCLVHQADLSAIPLQDESLDFGYCLGVLHHVIDPAEGLRRCVKLLKPGAPFLLYVYYALDSRPLWYRWAWRGTEGLRRLISRLPISSRHWVTDVIAAGVYWPLARAAKLLAIAGVAVEHLPLSVYMDRSFYVMRTDALDRFGTGLEHRFTKREVVELMRAAGLTDISFNDGPPYWVALGYKAKTAAA